jgi:5-oxoprolinase (ATP-hydrolysing) subunit A
MVIKDPDVAAKQVVEMIVGKTITSRNGKRISCQIDSLRTSGDSHRKGSSPRAGKAGVTLVPLTEMALD